MLKINNLTKYFGNQLILDNISFTIEEHEIVALVGANGCGKSTLLKIVAGLEEKNQGTIEFSNINKKNKTGLIFQNYRDQILPWKTVAQNIDFFLATHKKNYLEKRSKLINILKESQLYPYRNKYFYELSGGMAQLAVFANTIALDPAYYLLDEPFSAIDYLSSLKLQKLFLDLWEKEKTPTLLVTHNIDEAIFLAHKIIILSKPPTRIITTINNPLPQPRELSHLNTTQAQELKKQILSYITGFLI